jgi:Ca2+-binding RTX toxin-like protein
MRRGGLCPAIALLTLAAGLSTGAAATKPATCFGRTATIVGTPGDDTITGTPGSDVIYAGDGNDHIRGRGGADFICGGSGDEVIYGGDGSDRIRGGRPTWAEKLQGGMGNDYIVGGGRDPNGDGYWRAHGGPGNDTLVAARGTTYVTLSGGPGDDKLDTRKGFGGTVGDAGNDLLLGNGDFTPGPGNDKIRGHGLVSFEGASHVRVDLARGTAQGEGHDTISGRIDTVYGSDGDDVIRGTEGRDELIGRGGNDRIAGRGGNDRIEGDSGNDHVRGGEGDDQMFSAPGNEVLKGGAGDDEMWNERSEDVFADPQHSSFIGGAGHDYIDLTLRRTPAGDKPIVIDLKGRSMLGSEPLDLSGFEDVDVNTSSEAVVKGNAANNRIRLTASPSAFYGRGGDDSFEPSSANTKLDGGNGIDTAVFTGPFGVKIDLAAGTVSGRRGKGAVTNIERVIGSWASDSFKGDDGPNYFFGDDGDDVARGRGGDDTLDGWTGNDVLHGGDGNDDCKNGQVVSNCESTSGKY